MWAIWGPAPTVTGAAAAGVVAVAGAVSASVGAAAAAAAAAGEAVADVAVVEQRLPAAGAAWRPRRCSRRSSAKRKRRRSSGSHRPAYRLDINKFQFSFR